jgi:hypothetical protein
MVIFRHLFEKQSEHKERETQSASDQQNSTTDSCGAFGSSGSIVGSQYALSAKAVEHANESGRIARIGSNFMRNTYSFCIRMQAYSTVDVIRRLPSLTSKTGF